MVEEGIRGGICHSIHRYEKSNNKYMNDQDKIKYCVANDLYGMAMSQKLPVNNVEQIEVTSEFNKDFKEIIAQRVMKGIFSELMFNILRNYMNCITKNLLIYMMNLNMLLIEAIIKQWISS